MVRVPVPDIWASTVPSGARSLAVTVLFDGPFTVTVMAPAPELKLWVIERRKLLKEPVKVLVTGALGSVTVTVIVSLEESWLSPAVSDSVYVPATEKPAVVSTLPVEANATVPGPAALAQ